MHKLTLNYGLERFLEEARTLAKFQQHNGIVSVLNVFYGNGTGYMVMEYVDGLTLKEYLIQKDKLTWEQTLKLFMPVMDALREVHKYGMLHRDISPDNIYLCRDNRVKLLDFGSARYSLGGHSRSLSVVVKPGYAPEEQYRTKGNQGPWTDVYSVAASMYRCITGLVPPDALDRLDEDELRTPSKLGINIPDKAERELMAALAIKSNQRTQSIDDLQKGLSSIEVNDKFNKVQSQNSSINFSQSNDVKNGNKIGWYILGGILIYAGFKIIFDNPTYQDPVSKSVTAVQAPTPSNSNINIENAHPKINKEIGSLEPIDFRKLSYDWNDAHLTKDSAAFNRLFDETVLFYGMTKEKSYCIDAKMKFFKKYPSLNQEIYGNITIEEQTNGTVKASFEKRVTIDNKATIYPSYLIFKKINHSWKIITESDLVTDTNIAKKNIPGNAIKGDFNGDGNLDYMWIIEPKITKDGDDCVGGCILQIKFSDSSIPIIKIDQSIGGSLSNLGDLNNNGTDEVGFLSGWFTSCWQPYYVKTFSNNKWVNAVNSITTHCNQWDEGVTPIEIDNKINGNVIIRYSEFVNDSIVTLSKSVKITK
jgi:serine/threonine protein kinase